MKKYFTILFLAVLGHFATAQTDSDVLLTIDGRQITADEFMRIYNKNSSITIEDKKSVDDYLDLFIDYKLKVIEAENLGYDTMSSFIKEMAGYAKQLAKPYTDNSELLDSFVYEAYQHYKEEVNVSHILLRINSVALPSDTLKIYNRLMGLRNRIVSGEDWDAVIDDASPKDDPDKRIGGDLGWFTAFRMVYPFEAAAYNTPVGEISMPVRTTYGYHLLKVNGRRPNRGEAAVRHIMVVIPQNPNDLDVAAAREKIDKAYQALMNGADWDSIVVAYSEHKSTARNGGRLGYIRSGMGAPDELVEMSFKTKPGEISEPFRTEYGFHIIRVDEVRPIKSFEEVKDDFTKKVKQTSDIANITKEQKLNRIKKEYGFKFYDDRMGPIYEAFDSSLYKGEWDPSSAEHLTEVLFTIGDSTYTQFDAAKKVGERKLSYRGFSLKTSVYRRVKEFIDDEIEEYEIAQLPSKYPEYKNLLQEYHDGILLFNLTEEKVWKKAVEDTAGLKKFYNDLPEKYRWEERIALTKYTYADSSFTPGLVKLAKIRAKKGLDEKQISLKLCGQDTLPCVKFTELKYEKGDNAVADGMEWKKGGHTVTRDGDKVILYYVDAILLPQTKKLEDARGLYTADYQSYLEKLWVQTLREKYPVQVNEEVLTKLREQESGN